jgi:hypothetical protein
MPFKFTVSFIVGDNLGPQVRGMLEHQSYVLSPAPGKYGHAVPSADITLVRTERTEDAA